MSGQVTEDSTVQMRMPVADDVAIDAAKFTGTFAFSSTQRTVTICPGDGEDVIRLGAHPGDVPVAASLGGSDLILVVQGGIMKSTTVTAIGGGGTWQPLDSDLTAIAGLGTQPYGRSLLALANATAARSLLDAPSNADLSGYQPLDTDLTALAGLATDPFGRGLLTKADGAAVRSYIGAGTVQPEDLAAYQPLDSDLTEIALLATDAFGRSLLTKSTAAAVRSTIGAGTSDFPGDFASLASLPNPIEALAALFPLADTVPFFTGVDTADRMSFTEFSRAAVGQADANGWRYVLGVLSVDDALPKSNPTATGLFTAPAIRNTGGTPNRLVKWDAEGDEVASSLTDNGTTVSGTNLSASGAVDAGLSRMQSSAISPTDQAWFGYAGLNSAGAYVGYYPDEDGAIRIAAAAGQLVSLGTGAAYGQLVISDSGVKSSSLEGTGDRPALVDSTGKFKPDPRAGVQSGSGAIAINASTKRMLRVTGTASLQLGSPASCAEVTVEVTAAFNGDIGITGEHEYCDTSPAYWYYSSTGRTVTVGNFGSDGPLRKFTLSCDGVHWYFKG